MYWNLQFERKKNVQARPNSPTHHTNHDVYDSQNFDNWPLTHFAAKIDRFRADHTTSIMWCPRRPLPHVSIPWGWADPAWSLQQATWEKTMGFWSFEVSQTSHGFLNLIHMVRKNHGFLKLIHHHNHTATSSPSSRVTKSRCFQVTAVLHSAGGNNNTSVCWQSWTWGKP